MKERKLIEKNLELSFEFTRYLMAHPEVEKQIPSGALVVILPEYDDELKRFNLRNSKRGREKKQPVVYVRIKRLASDRPSRLIGTKIERVA